MTRQLLVGDDGDVGGDDDDVDDPVADVKALVSILRKTLIAIDLRSNGEVTKDFVTNMTALMFDELDGNV